MLMLVGLVGTIGAFTRWGSVDFGQLTNARDTVRLVLPSATLIAVGGLCVFSGLLGSLMTLRGIATPRVAVTVPGQREPTDDVPVVLADGKV